MVSNRPHPQVRESYPEYTLTELCIKAGITPPIMKKYQMLFKIGSGTKKGERTYYSETQLKIYRRIKELRSAGIEYDEIVELFQLEQKLSSRPYDGEVVDTGNEHFEPGTRFWVRPVFDEISTQPIKEDWREDKKLEPLINRHIAIRQRIVRKAKETEATLKRLLLDVDPDEQVSDGTVML